MGKPTETVSRELWHQPPGSWRNPHQEVPPVSNPGLAHHSPLAKIFIASAILQEQSQRLLRAHPMLVQCLARETEAPREVELWPRTQKGAGPSYRPRTPGSWQASFPSLPQEDARLPSANTLPYLSPEPTLQGTCILCATDYGGVKRIAKGWRSLRSHLRVL